MPRPQEIYMSTVYHYITGRNVCVNPAWIQTITDLFNTKYILSVGYYILYMFHNTMCNNPPSPHDYRYMNIRQLSYIYLFKLYLDTHGTAGVKNLIW